MNNNDEFKIDDNNDNFQEDAKLIAGTELIEPLIDHYGLASYPEISNVIKHWTNLTISERDIVFYNNTPYWVIYFTEGSFTVLNKDGQFLDNDMLDSLVSTFISLSTFSKIA